MRRAFTIIILMTIILMVPLSLVQAQGTPAVQELTGSLAPDQIDVYLIAGMKKGQTLDALMENTSGNLDPILSILKADKNLSATLQNYKIALADLIANSPTPLIDLPALRDKFTLAWDDDSGPGYDAALKFTAPADGDYHLLVGSSLSAAGRSTFGNYRLLLGMDVPGVLDNSAHSTGAVIAVQDQAVLEPYFVQDFTGSLTAIIPSAS